MKLVHYNKSALWMLMVWCFSSYSVSVVYWLNKHFVVPCFLLWVYHKFLVDCDIIHLPIPSGLLHLHWDNLMIPPVLVNIAWQDGYAVFSTKPQYNKKRTLYYIAGIRYTSTMTRHWKIKKVLLNVFSCSLMNWVIWPRKRSQSVQGRRFSWSDKL